MNVFIVGGGKVGRHLAALLADAHQVKLIETRPERIALIAQEAPQAVAVQGSGTDPVLLERAGIRQCDVVAAVTGQDETNLVVTTLARFEFGVARTIGRINNPRNAWMFTADMGVDVPVNQADLMVHLIAEEMSLGDMMTLLKLRRGRYALVEEKIPANAKVLGQAIKDVRFPEQCVIAAIIRHGEIVVPRGATTFEAGDEILAVTDRAGAAQLAELFKPAR